MPSEAQAKSLVCVGNLTIDEAVRSGVRSAPAMGGDAAYAALAAKLFIDDVRMFAPIGTDLPSWVLESIRSVAITAEELPVRNLPTVRNVINYFPDGTRVWDMLCSEEDFDALSVYPADVPPSVLAADALMLSAMSFESQIALTPWMRKNSSAVLYLDLQEDYLVGNREALFSIIATSDVFLPSEVEAVELSGTRNLEAAARTFAALGPKTVVIKRAEQGSLVLEHDVITRVPAESIDPVDSTGAGDAFCGAFAAVHLETGDAVAAARAGSTAARIAISDFGIAPLLAECNARARLTSRERR